MSRARQIIKKEKTKQLILDTAKDILVKEGVNKLSIRKITNTLDYSPGIIYHYFKDKDEIVETILKDNYKKMLQSLRISNKYEDDPEREIIESFNNYINTVLEFSEEYKAFLFNDKPSILRHTGMLHEGISEERESIKMLCNSIAKGIQLNQFRECDIELTAQTLWVFIFGLTTRLIIENDIPQEQRVKLINNHFDIIMNGIKKGD